MADPPMMSAMATSTPPIWSILNTFTTDPLLSFIRLRLVRRRADARVAAPQPPGAFNPVNESIRPDTAVLDDVVRAVVDAALEHAHERGLIVRMNRGEEVAQRLRRLPPGLTTARLYQSAPRRAEDP